MPRHLPGEGYPAPHYTEDELRRINVPTGPAPGAPRRVRTQVERDADGTTLRAMAGLPDPNPERVEQMRAAFAESAATGKPVLLPDGSASVSYRPPRRRWWHRYTRRTR